MSENKRVSLAGNISSKARAEYDQGRVTPSLQLSYMTLELAPSPAQKTALQQLLVEQQTPGSANYHRWLTPEEFAQQFGATSSDIAQLSGWLQSHGLTVTSVARGRNWIAFDGQAAQVENAFQTELHQYAVNGESHFANSSNPSIPAAFSGTVIGIRGLNDFRLKPRARLRSPDYTGGRGAQHFVVPDDLATIYDIGPLYSSGINGSGQKIAIAGQTEINLSDIETFRSTYGLPSNDPQTILVGRNPGISSADLGEADLDTEWSGAVARNATILYVYALDVMTAVQYAIDNAVAPVVSVSYGLCEQEEGLVQTQAMRGWAQQANAQGITWFAAAGDNGAADCDDSQNPGLAVDVPASIPEVTGVGGTEFSEGTGTYWSTTNSSTGESALSYIPGVVWNDAENACQSYPSASGGGASIFFSKPSWQTGLGVPADGARDVPDIAINASCAHDSYFVYSGGSLQAYGGTSFGGPIFSGLTALINQYAVSTGAQSSPGQGNFNVRLYALAASAANTFHDITVGNNIVTVSCSGPVGRGGCTSTPVGYTAHAGYDQTTGWGSIDANLLVTRWTSATVVPPPPAVALALVASETTIAPTDVVDLIATVTDTSGATPSGSVEFSAGSTVLGSATLTGSTGTGTASATLAVPGSSIPSNATITATYSGSSTSVGVTLTSTGHGPSAAPTLSGVTNAASYKQSYAPGELISLFGSQLSLITQPASSLPLPVALSGLAATINGIVAPLMYISADQVNLQIPNEVTPGTSATLTLNNNGQTASKVIPISAAAPGIFVDQNSAVVPTSSAQAGQQITIYVTGVGAVSPAVSDGAAPSSSTPLSSLPAPVQTTTVTVGGATANIQFIGIPDWSAGVVQINFVVPAGLASGQQQVVVTVGGIASAPALLTVMN
ncbi:MAG TPA: protease pro-enzyme activation domain-containing protein [Bryobacteraceae bacterium]